MAKSSAVWGIDIGQCAVKALRCRPGDDDSSVVADAFDYIEYPKILSQPDADPAELVREALELFLSRNSVRGDKVAISVSGQSGLARFIKLPPVESKKIPDIVKYEARQQIPFALEDVVWDYQQMPGGSEEDGFALETEVGLFAMKRDQVDRALKPFEEAGIEVDVVQLTPLTIYNYTVFDQMQDLPPADQYDPDNPPESVVVLSLGTDTTDLVITNGYRVWQRSVPLGGSHFTKALTKELRLTFAKAEHLKKNAAKADDPKAVFQAMRPVFNDLLTQIQRSIGYFTSIDRGAKIGRVIALGNAMKLPGLQKYLSQNLGFPVGEVKNYRGVMGDTVVTAPAFKENLLSFAVCYGLVLQGLGHAKLATNLLPPEIVTDRMIREKKPWAVGLVAMLLLGCAASFFGHWRAWNSVDLKKFDSALKQAQAAEGTATSGKSAYETALNDFKATSQIGEGLVGNVDGRLLWLEMMTALSQCLPKDETRPEDIMDRNEVHISELECEWQADLATWYQAGVADKIKEMEAAMAAAAAPGAAAPATSPDGAPTPEGAAPAAPDAAAPGAATAEAAAPAADPAAPAAATPAPEDTGPKGPGWIIQLRGEHFHNKQSQDSAYVQGSAYVRDTLVKNLREKEIELPGKDGKPEKLPLKELGIGYPVILETSGRILDETLTDAERNTTSVRKFTFVVQFAWSPTPLSKRIEARQQKATGQAPALADSP
ncbi:MAG TPA: type IV pilus assembly protein PilM [Pirellulales bacterium]|jgi:type IV pilus assembly protein PilM|nr:type IV pilus assembly protein PilM [Pirellulales bacterium]